MENQNILTIKFNNTEDLALKIAEWNEILNHQCCGNCHDEKHPAEQVTKAMCETAPKAESQPQPVVQEKVKSEPEPEPEPALDVSDEPVDKKAFYKEFREWMGEDGVKAKKALAIFSKHGVTRPSSDSLTDDLITDLKSIMAEKEA